ncbi:MAG: HlyD family efflux transporter periplasmic adaptor subunit [Pseudomonadota bacterium]|nr:HlyD family efflux transporter periplasmic adaptor subunit [Pseudomonadota bacterium]
MTGILGAVVAAGALLVPLVRDGDTPRTYQGYMEGNLVLAAPEETGRIVRLEVDAGDEVAPDQLLFTLEASMQEAQRVEAEARLGQARAQLANLKAAQQRPEQVAVLRATEERARAALELSRNELHRQQLLFQKGYTAKARLDQAAASFERDKAALEEVQRQIEAAQLAGRTAEIEAAEAAVHAAEAAVRQAEVRLARRRVASPVAARVQDVYFRTGEVVNAGQPVLALLPPGNLHVRFYVPEPELSGFALGQMVAIKCDRCGPDLKGRVSFISREAEFTPPVIFSEQERAKLVFRVEARPENDAARLAPGLPVSVRLLPMAPLASR